MKRDLPSLLVAAILAVGCRDAEHKSTDSDQPAAVAPEFSVKHGLLLPEATRQSLGLKVVEVVEQRMSATLDLPLSVYEQTGTRARATGFLAPEQAKGLKAGQPIEVWTGEGKALAGKVTAVNEELQKAIGQVEVLVEIPEADTRLAVGTFVRATLSAHSDQSVITLPPAALLRCSEGQFVYTVSGDHLVRTAVKVGARNSECVEITEGLYAGDQVVSQPVLSLWLTELASVKGGQACCIEPPKGK